MGLQVWKDRVLLCILASILIGCTTTNVAPTVAASPTTTSAPSMTATAVIPLPSATIPATPINTPRPFATTALFKPTVPRIATPTLTPIVLNAPPAMIRYEIVQTKHPQAVCNDGSTPVFYYRRGSGSGANKWVVWFKGGGACFDSSSCADRERSLVTAKAWTRREIENDGILSRRPEQNPDLYNWNQVLMVYCTSDMWTGTSPDNNNEVGWYFRGHYVVNAIMDALMDANVIGKPTLREGTHLLLSGSSAGAHGLFHHLDRLAQSLSWMDVRAVSDAGLGFIVNPEIQPMGELIRQKQWQVWRPVFDESCVAANAAAPNRCADTYLLVREHHLTTPMFYRQDLLDSLALENNQLQFRNPAHRPLIETFANTIATLLQSQSGAFGTSKRQHVMIETTEFNTYRVNGLTFAQVLGNWYWNRNEPQVVIESLPRQ